MLSEVIKKMLLVCSKLIIINQRMKIILWLLLVVASNCIIYSKISTQFSNPLTSADYLLSAMGFFRMTINSQTCQLQIQNFTGTNYGIIGYYPRTVLAPCKFYSIINNSFISNNNDVILSLQATQIQSVYDQIFVTIDQMGIIRINGVFNKRYQSSQNWISIFRTPHQYLYSISSLSVTKYSSLSFVSNSGNWGFSAINGELRLFRIDDVSKIIRYNYTSFTITPNNLFDYNSNSLPKADYSQFKYYPTCASQNELQNFQGPFTFIINQYWPEIRLIDRKGYEIIALRYPKPHCTTVIGLDNLHNADSCMGWFCPTNTFQLKGDCLVVCPLPYYHQIGKNGINRCVINCQAGFDKDNIKRICSCGKAQNYQCPSNLKSAPFGCLCPDKKFFNPYNQIINNVSNYCYSSCGPFLYPHKDGLCVPCPQYCQICTLSSNSYSYLRCNVCRQGYNVNSQGFCVRNCINPRNTTNNSSCLRCNITFCFNCSSSITVCDACSKPYSLFNNMCLIQCPRGFKTLFDQLMGFKCVMIPGCSVQAQIVNDINNQSSCFCMRNGIPTYSKNCGNFTNKSCPFDNYFDFNTMECLSCPIGCLTCIQDKSNKIQCTSCRPDYSLFVSVSKNHFCQRISILSICSNNYDFSTHMCMVNNLTQIVASIGSRSMCFLQVNNCSICINDSLTQCSICATDYYLFQGKCFSTCPYGTSPYNYQGVCIKIEKENCLREKTERAYWIFIKNTLNQFSQGYQYLISTNFQVINILNDPLGSIFSFLRMSNGNSRRKQINIATSRQKCVVCSKGYGITSDGSCEKCKHPCVQCIYNSNIASYCLNCDSDYRLNASNICQKLEVTELPCRYGQYRNQSRICQPDCLTYRRSDFSILQKNKSFSINCSLNCPNGYSVSTFLNSKNEKRLTCQKNTQDGNDLNANILLLGNKIRLQRSIIYMIMSSSILEYSANISIDVEVARSTKQRLLGDDQNNNVKSYKTTFGMIVIDNSPILSDTVLVRLPSAQIQSTSKGKTIYLSNSIYGIGSSSKSFIDIIQNDTSNMYFYGRAYIVVAFLLTIVFLAEKINYKTDNLFITFSVIYLVLPSLNLYPDSSSLNSYSFLYGFSWSTHLQLFSNPRLVTKQTNWFDGYLQSNPNNAHYLLFIDSNIIRNGWSIILVMMVSIGVLGILILIMKSFSVNKIKQVGLENKCKCLSNWKRFGYNNQDFDHSQQIRYLLLFLIENSFIGLCYYSVITLKNASWELAPPQKQNIFKIISSVCLITIFIYSLLRFYTYRIGGLYCLKRMFLGVVLGLISSFGGINENKPLAITLLILLEVLFIAMRYKYEFVTNYFYSLVKGKPKIIQLTARKIKNRQTLNERPTLQQEEDNDKKQFQQKQESLPEKQQFWGMVIEQLLIIIVYIFSSLVNELKQVSVLVVWIIITAFMVYFIIQIVDMIINYWSNTYERAKQQQIPFYKRIRNNWDHDLSLKSLTSTNF